MRDQQCQLRDEFLNETVFSSLPEARLMRVSAETRMNARMNLNSRRKKEVISYR